jgi:hypothetical protein
MTCFTFLSMLFIVLWSFALAFYLQINSTLVSQTLSITPLYSFSPPCIFQQFSLHLRLSFLSWFPNDCWKITISNSITQIATIQVYI